MSRFSILASLFILLNFNIAVAQDLKIINAEEFIAENPSPERQEIVDFIIHQFDDKREIKITQAELDHIWSNKDNREKFMMYRFQIINQKLYADSYDQTHADFRSTLKYFNNLIKHYKIPDVDFIIYRRDRMPSNIKTDTEQEAAEFPALLMSKNINSPYEKDKILIPDNFVAHRAWKALTEGIIQANIHHPWENKTDKIFWRGGTSNGTYDIKNFDKLPRLKLVILSKLFPDLIDAEFSVITHQFPDTSGAKNMKKLLKILFNDPKEVKEVDHLEYKYLVSIDGNTCAWARVPWIMLSNSVLLKQETDNMEWFYPALKPYVNYAPLNTELTDIFSQAEWMKTHDDELKQISNNATNFAMNNLMSEHIDTHMVIVLSEYHKLHRDKKIIPNLSSYNDMMSLWSLISVLARQIQDNFISWKNSLEFDFI